MRTTYHRRPWTLEIAEETLLRYQPGRNRISDGSGLMEKEGAEYSGKWDDGDLATGTITHWTTVTNTVLVPSFRWSVEREDHNLTQKLRR
ncbi:hypothetical protein EVAR_53243_1 [Eumeta japonica]|uniref:Uncharacterized protein n=1 Tax=Eumeta variegata TaxID=151549 RepID=A0A4C1XD20_EUMVA|nr:hypothetical protein EVAR_53243_1 [Eumeta japonica]